MEYWRSELYHHGIKGQKWGERNYQNPDGSLTPAGKIRYGVASNKTVGYKDAVAASKSNKELSISEYNRHKASIERANAAETEMYNLSRKMKDAQFRQERKQVKADKKSGKITKQEAKALKKDIANRAGIDFVTEQGQYLRQLKTNREMMDNLLTKVSKKSVLEDRVMDLGMKATDSLIKIFDGK